MQRTNKIKAFYNRMSIKNKIALIYSLVFILIIFLVSCFIVVNSIVYYRTSSEKEIDEVLDNIEQYIKDGGDISNEAIKEQVQNPYIEVRVNLMRSDMPMPNRNNRPSEKPSEKLGENSPFEGAPDSVESGSGMRRTR